MDCSLPGSSVHGILQARILKWVAISFFRGSSQPRDWTRVSCIAGRFSTTEPPWKPLVTIQSSLQCLIVNLDELIEAQQNDEIVLGSHGKAENCHACLISHSLQCVGTRLRPPQGCLQLRFVSDCEQPTVTSGSVSTGKDTQAWFLPKGSKTMLERQICVKYDLKKMLGHSQQEDPQKSEKGEVFRSQRPVRLSSLEALFQAGGGDQGEEPRKGLLPIFSFLKRKCYSFWMLSRFSHVQLCATLWTVNRQAPLSMGLSGQKYWGGLPCPPPRHLLHQGAEPASLMSPALAGRLFTTPPGKPRYSFLGRIRVTEQAKPWIIRDRHSHLIPPLAVFIALLKSPFHQGRPAT